MYQEQPELNYDNKMDLEINFLQKKISKFPCNSLNKKPLNKESLNKESNIINIPFTNKLIKLSNVGIIALDIIIKELTNAFHHTLFTSDEIKETLLQEISNYLLDKETYALTYSSKKAIDIIKLEYMDNNMILYAINNQLSTEDKKPIKINKKRQVEPCISNLIKKQKYEYEV